MALLDPRAGAARALNLALRTVHLAGMAALGGGVLFDAPAAGLRPWLALTVGSGLALLLSEASHSRHWIYQGRGLFTLAHLGLLALLGVTPSGVAAALIVGAVGSHLPRTIRKWSLRHRGVVD